MAQSRNRIVAAAPCVAVTAACTNESDPAVAPPTDAESEVDLWTTCATEPIRGHRVKDDAVVQIPTHVPMIGIPERSGTAGWVVLEGSWVAIDGTDIEVCDVQIPTTEGAGKVCIGRDEPMIVDHRVEWPDERELWHLYDARVPQTDQVVTYLGTRHGRRGAVPREALVPCPAGAGGTVDAGFADRRGFVLEG